MRIVVSGQEKNLDRAVTISTLLQELQVLMPDMVSVSVNGNFVPREEYGTRATAEGDEIEFLYFMGGGAVGVY